jgi:glycosyltransferase involved in cell wall biosynthesis
MKILWIPHTAWHIPQRAQLFCRALAERHEVHVTDWVADFTSLRDYFSARYLRNFLYKRRREDNITIHSVPRISPALFVPALRRINTAIFSRLVRQIIKRHRIDVVVGTFLLPPPKAPRLVFDLFDENVAYWRNFGNNMAYADEIARTEAAYLRGADAVVAASSVLADKARHAGARGPIYHIPNGVDLCQFRQADGAKFRAQLGVHGRLVGSVANHDKPIELEKILDAAQALSGSDITFLIAGRGTAIQSGKARAESDNLSNVIFRGYIPPDEAPSVIGALDVGLCSYTKSTMDDARSPMRLLMYAAAGVPTVCTDLEEVRRMQFANVVLVDDSVQSLVEGIERALQLPKARPPQIEAYDLQSLVAHYEAVLLDRADVEATHVLPYRRPEVIDTE